MFGLGMGELLIIMVIALIFLGPKKLPDIASSLGKAIRSFRKATNDLTNQLEVDESVKQPLRELKAALRDEPALQSPSPSSVAPAPAPQVPVAQVPVGSKPLDQLATQRPLGELAPELKGEEAAPAAPSAPAGDLPKA